MSQALSVSAGIPRDLGWQANISFNDLEKYIRVCSFWRHQAGVWRRQECFVRALNPIKIDVLAMVKAGDGGMKSAGYSQKVK